jgi:NAD(P)-dependent dehydrogenase (short-subunit alcohol dehydrogenase family)
MNPVEGPFAPTLKSLTATGDYGKGEDIAQAVVFLASANASYVTGTTLTVDGGANA